MKAFIVFLCVLLAETQGAEEGSKCQMEDGSTGICRVLTDCKSRLQNVIAGKNHPVAVRCGFTGIVEIVCCSASQQVEVAVPPEVNIIVDQPWRITDFSPPKNGGQSATTLSVKQTSTQSPEVAAFWNQRPVGAQFELDRKEFEEKFPGQNFTITEKFGNPWETDASIPEEIEAEPCVNGDVHRIDDACSNVIVCRKNKPELVKCEKAFTYDRPSDSCRYFFFAKC